jgi:ligand-binding sensor domain-containing protein/signal transduction histidine kinase
VARTRDGYLWVATLDGLARFDGARFTVFNSVNTPPLGDSHISSLLVDSSGVLWVSTFAGTLVRRDGTGFAAVNLGAATPHEGFLHLAQDAEGAVWIATLKAGLIRLREGRAKVFGTASGFPAVPIRQVVCDTRGGLWVLAGGRLWALREERWLPMSPLSQPVRAIARSRDGGLWVGLLGLSGIEDRGGRIFKVKDGQWHEEQGSYLWNQDSQRSRIESLMEDSAGRLWCGTTGAGIYHRETTGEWREPIDHGGLSSLINCLEEDEDGSVWVGTEAVGLFQLRPRVVGILRPPAGGEGGIFWTVCVRRDGSIWGGADGGGAYCWRGSSMRHYGAAQGLANQQVAVLLEDRRTNLWAGTLGGLYRLAGSGESFEPVPGPWELRRAVTALFEDHQGILWVGTDAGLLRLKGQEVRVFNKADGLPDPLTIQETEKVRDQVQIPFDNTRITRAGICAVVEDREGRIWVAAAGRGLFLLQGERFEHFDQLNQWGWENQIRALYADADGMLWVATYGYWLYRLKDGQFRVYDPGQGVPNSHIQAILDDGAGNLWFSSDYGIFGASRRVLNELQPGRSLFPNWWWLLRANGLANKVCSGIGQPTGMRAPDGRVWFPDGDALASFDPTQLVNLSRPLPPIIEEAVVDGLAQTPGPDGSLRVIGRGRRLDVRYTSPNTRMPESLQFWHRMDGVDTNWVDMDREPLSQRTSSYALQPGQYEFRVAVVDPGGTLREARQSLKIRVILPFWERPVTQAGSALLLLATVAVTVRRMERRRSERRLKLLELQRAMTEERQRIARDIHDDLGSGLTEIIMEAEHLGEDFPQTPTSEQQIRAIAARARALTWAMGEVVWAINPRNDTLESLLTYVNNFAQEYLTRFGGHCRCDAPKELSDDFTISATARHNLYLVSKEALHNVVKHAAGSEVWIRLQLDEDGFVLSIEDNGPGFDPSRRSGCGQGLQNMKQRLEDIGGRCEILSALGAGTRVRLFLPAGHRAAKAPKAKNMEELGKKRTFPC